MDKNQDSKSLPIGREPITSIGLPGRGGRGIAAFLICCALFTAVFAVSALCMRAKGRDWMNGFWGGTTEQSKTEKQAPTADATAPALTGEENEKKTLEGTPIVTLDLSYPHLGSSYYHNETPYKPSVEALLERPLLLLEDWSQPRVLILHTHTSEAYVKEPQKAFGKEVGDVTYSKDESQNVMAVGRILCEVLNQKGVTAIHCAVTHDEPTLNGSYAKEIKK